MKVRLSIYLAKKTAKELEQLLNLERVKAPIELTLTDAKAHLFIKQDYEPQIPEWADLFFSAKPDLPYDIFGRNSSTGAILLIDYKGERFIFPFGTGHHLINDNYIVREFGLKVTLNSISQNKIRSLDKGNHNETNLLTRSQSTREVSIYNLKIDSELDILTTLTGICTEDLLGDKVTGRDALVITPDMSFGEITGLLDKIIEIYKKPLPNEFEWINNIKQADDEEVEILDFELVDLINSGDFTDIIIGEPEIVDWEKQIGYCFERRNNSPIYPVLALGNFLEYCKFRKIDITIDVLKNKNIHSLNEQYESIKSWSIYRCLYAEIKSGDKSYILRNGVWYCADTKFLLSIDDEINKIPTYENSQWLPTYSFDYEEDYIKDVCAKDSSFHLMDQKFIYHGSGHSKIEFCDMIKDGKTLIHVKYYTGSQSMSHLFSQGYVSGELFVGDKEFRKKLNVHLPDDLQTDFNLRPETKDYKIVFAIATKNELPKGLPLFSKINLKNFHRQLSNLGYNVRLCKIDIDELIYKKKTYRPS
ncbi:TIGR04141 family sporadically distributed protein [Pectobacterium parmentieri]|uniref:TIGR04141 family sporadically distributed protein n=1 Tax=Pectobacterium parmentieri TaxID=1905730 RepID=UPI0018E18709|nr:TIGR04141 family sporadically distributed protein [Pectobacterium parmentieri]QQA74581.1 TIGR04141 family sporadically distributed protein [Pectobacterium parmentieri]